MNAVVEKRGDLIKHVGGQFHSLRAALTRCLIGGLRPRLLAQDILHRHPRNYVILDDRKTMSKAPKARTVILTVGVTATAITGAWYGAGLKIKQDIKKV